jgi:hypothetical protein
LECSGARAVEQSIGQPIHRIAELQKSLADIVSRGTADIAKPTTRAEVAIAGGAE